MRKIYRTLQKLRDFEKRERQMQLAFAEQKRLEISEETQRLGQELLAERNMTVDGPADAEFRDRLVTARFYNLTRSEDALSTQEEVVSLCVEQVKHAQRKAQMMEELIESIQKREAIEQNRKDGKILDDLAGVGWWRRQAESF